MKVLVKYFFWLLSFFFVIIYYLLGTTLGHRSLGYLLENHYSEVTDNNLKIHSLNLEHYPYIIAEIKINEGAKLWLDGKFDEENMLMSYHLKGDTFRWDNYYIANPIEVKGEMKGKFSSLLVRGKGTVFDGNISYVFTRKPKRLEAMQVRLNEVHAPLLLEFLKYKKMLIGEIDVFMDFNYFTAYRRKGLVKVTMEKGFISEVSKEMEVRLEAEIVVKDLLHEFFAEIDADVGKLRFMNGYYNRSAGLVTVDYGLHINELSSLEKLLKHKYYGIFDTAGSLKYEAKRLSLLGDSTSYDGLLEYEYKNDYLNLDFKAVSLEKFLRQLSFPPLLSSKIYGSASYDIRDEIILVNTELKETRFRRTKMTDTIYELTGIDVLQDVYNDSIFTAGYQNSVLTSLLQIDNGVNHLYLKDTRMNSKTNEVTADFEVQIDNQEFFGKVYGTLDKPEVSLDMSRLIQYQINKKIDNFFGTGKPLNQENTKEKLNKIQKDFNEKVQTLEVDEVKQKARSFLNGFFN